MFFNEILMQLVPLNFDYDLLILQDIILLEVGQFSRNGCVGYDVLCVHYAVRVTLKYSKPRIRRCHHLPPGSLHARWHPSLFHVAGVHLIVVNFSWPNRELR